MIITDPLAVWLGDSEARNATDARTRALAAAIAEVPAFAAMKRGLAPAIEEGAQAVLALARAFIEDDEAIAAILAAGIAAAAADPFCRPPLRASRNEVQDGLVLFNHPALSVQLAVMGADALVLKRRARDGRASISFTGQRSLFRFVKGGSATLSVWRAPFIEPGFTAASGGRCRRHAVRRLADGDVIEIDGRFESFVVDQAGSDLVYLFASTPLEASPVGAEYDSDSLELVASSSTDDASSRTQMMLALLRTLERDDAAPLFAERLRAAHFYARWQAMRELLALDAGLALPHLRAMAAGDPHPEVRAAAARTLADFFSDQPEDLEPPLPCPA
jgi:hypothetical protein